MVEVLPCVAKKYKREKNGEKRGLTGSDASIEKPTKPLSGGSARIFVSDGGCPIPNCLRLWQNRFTSSAPSETSAMWNVRCLNSLMLCCALGASLVPANAQSSLGAQAGGQTSVANTQSAAPVMSGMMGEQAVTNMGFWALSCRLFEEVDQRKSNSQYLESNSGEESVLPGSCRAGGRALCSAVQFVRRDRVLRTGSAWVENGTCSNLAAGRTAPNSEKSAQTSP